MGLRIAVGIILVLMVLPILVIIPLSFSSEVAFHLPPESYSFKWYQKFFADDEWIAGLRRSVSVAIFTSILSTILGIMAAFSANRLDFPGKKLFMNLILGPMIFPVIVVGIALYHSFSAYKLTDKVSGLVLAHTILALPFVFVTVLASLKGTDKNLELAALSLGSTPIGAFFKITLPIMRSAITASALFAFITSLDEAVVSIFISGARTKTLPIMMWDSMNFQVDPTIAVVSTLLIAATILIFILLPGLIPTGKDRNT
ncbi:ABC transporter permease [Paenibacillus beijingensis]|uniref:Polyamine ABC transporter permease n=1 Tax=Paenibacillus beijingensis TaxID=1126833 RepID=A0A0D5NFP9_9BACL|nr:ABC transporter permease [Paenibacillus beijingensis]AJY73797.1 polyamine ABC transporter permease [Paenibacillus beijingensis]